MTTLLARLRDGQSAAQAVREIGLGPSEYLMMLGQAALGSDDPAEWPGLFRGSPRERRLGPALRESAWADLFPDSTRPRRLAMAAALLQVHDFWDESHQAAQEADDLGEGASSAFWHAIAHRREPDPGNAGYWFRRVGRHPIFATLVRESQSLLEGPGDARRIAPVIADSTWDPFRFVDFCMSARRDPGSAALALRLQRLEMATLFEATIRALLAS